MKMQLPVKKTMFTKPLKIVSVVLITFACFALASSMPNDPKNSDFNLSVDQHPDGSNPDEDVVKTKAGSFLESFSEGGNAGFVHAFIASISVIIVSELGDKTFFIAAIMAMRHPRLTVFMGALWALTIMTILSAFVGYATTLIPRIYVHYVSTALFAIFGLKMLKEAYSMSPDEGQEEYEEVQKSLNKRETEFDKDTQPLDEESGAQKKNRSNLMRRRLMICLSRVFLEAFTMTFLAEWGDRSQLATIILAARENAVGVTIGAILGHGLCTGLAVLGGRMIAQKISVRTVTFVGAITFLIFAISSLIMGPGS